MKKHLINLLNFILFLSLAFFLNTCKDPCKNVICYNNGYCSDGVCICQKNYSGVDCSIFTDPCKDIECVHGICIEGYCICDVGYEGLHCETIMREKFLGPYVISDNCEPYNRFSVIYEHETIITKVIISNIINQQLGGNAIAEIERDIISIPQQQVVDNNSETWTIKGLTAGTFLNNNFIIRIRYTKNTVTKDCILTFTKQ